MPVNRASLDIEGETAFWRRPTDGGYHTNCHFCPSCGSRLFHAGDNRPGLVTIKGGSLDTAAALNPVAHIWIRSKQDWVVVPNGVPQWETQPRNQEEWMKLLAWTN